MLQGQVVALERQTDSHHVGIEHPKGLIQQLLAGLVSLKNDDPDRVGARTSLHVGGFQGAAVCSGDAALRSEESALRSGNSSSCRSASAPITTDRCSSKSTPSSEAPRWR